VEVERLKIFPEVGRSVPNFNDDKLREIIFGNYRIIYEIKKTSIEILTIWHSKRLLNKESFKR
jgi:toxin ParE1/3/4